MYIRKYIVRDMHIHTYVCIYNVHLHISVEYDRLTFRPEMQCIWPSNTYGVNKTPLPLFVDSLIQEDSSVVAQTAAINACRGKHWQYLSKPLESFLYFCARNFMESRNEMDG